MSENTSQDKAIEPPPLKRGSGFAKALNWTSRLLMEAGSVVLSLAILWLGALGVLMNRPSVDLQFVKPHYENWFSQAFDGKITDIETYSARWINDRSLIEIRAKNIRIRAEDGTVQTIEDVRGQFRVNNNLLATPDIVRLNIVGGAITVIREQDGRLQVAMGKPDTVEKIGALWRSDRKPSGEKTSGMSLLAQIEKIDVAKADLYIVDHIDGLDLRITDLDGALNISGEHIVLNAIGGIVMDGIPDAPFSLDIQTTIDRQTFDIDLAINNLVPVKIAPKRGSMAVVGLLEAPVDLDANIKVTALGGLEDLKLNLVAGAGRLKTGTSFKPFSHALILAGFNKQANGVNGVNIEALEVESEALNIIADGVLDLPGPSFSKLMERPVGFNINIGSARLNPGRKFDGPLIIKPSHISGKFTAKSGDVVFDKLRLDFGSFQTDLSGGMRRNQQGEITGITADGVITGTVSKAQLLGFWPHGFVLGARNWIVNSLQSGEASNIKVRVALDENDIKTGRIANENLSLRYDVTKGEVRYMSKMPWLRAAYGYGILRGNSADFYLNSGTVDGLRIKSGHVIIAYGRRFHH